MSPNAFLVVLMCTFASVLSNAVEASWVDVVSNNYEEHTAFSHVSTFPHVTLLSLRHILKTGITKRYFTVSKSQRGPLLLDEDISVYNVPEEYLDHSLSPTQLLDLVLKNGGTFVLLDAEGFTVEWNDMVSECMSRTRCPCGLSIYVTAAHVRGVEPHFDTMDVVAIQSLGTKEWSLYDPPIVAHPTQKQHVNKLRETKLSKKSAANYTLGTAGDMLYVPRGVAHNTSCLSNEPCVHLSLGIECPLGVTWEKYFHDTIQCSQDDNAWMCSMMHILVDVLALTNPSLRRAAFHIAGNDQSLRVLNAIRRDIKSFLEIPERIRTALTKYSVDSLVPITSHLSPLFQEGNSLTQDLENILKGARSADWNEIAPAMRMRFDNLINLAKEDIQSGGVQDWARIRTTNNTIDPRRNEWFRLNVDKNKRDEL
eukprot:PhF_6_TR19047/c0_g1_i1/m.27987